MRSAKKNARKKAWICVAWIKLRNRRLRKKSEFFFGGGWEKETGELHVWNWISETFLSKLFWNEKKMVWVNPKLDKKARHFRNNLHLHLHLHSWCLWNMLAYFKGPKLPASWPNEASQNLKTVLTPAALLEAPAGLQEVLAGPMRLQLAFKRY